MNSRLSARHGGSRSRAFPTVTRARVVAVALLAAVATAVTVSVAWAAPAANGSVGRDVSHPQCGAPLPTDAAFGIVGVNGGRAYLANPCLASQFAWAKGRKADAGVYVNTGNPAPRSSYYWPASGAKDPALCTDSTSTTDPGCAYDYGWHAAADSLAIATKADRSITKVTWWLDVETANSWNGDGKANAADLQGAFDYLRSHGVAEVGIYSTGYQWNAITGGYTTSTAATYKAAWKRAFTPKYALESAPLWIATAGDRAGASQACSTTITGAKARLVQFDDGSGFDADLVCGKPAATAPTAPTAVTAAPAAQRGVTLTWSAPASDGGSALRSYVVARSRTAGTGKSYAQVRCTDRTCSWTDPDTTRNTPYYYTVTATNSVGSSPPSAEVTARAR